MTDIPPTEWAPVVDRAVNGLWSASDVVQIVAIICLTATVLAILAARIYGRRQEAMPPPPPPVPPPPGHDDNSDVIALAKAISSMAEEQGRSVHQLAKSVDDLHGTVARLETVIVGCTTCPWHPNQGKA